MNDAMDQRLRSVFATLFRVEAGELTDNTRRGALPGWDSLGHLELVVALENEFGMTLSPDEALEIETFADARNVVEREVAGR